MIIKIYFTLEKKINMKKIVILLFIFITQIVTSQKIITETEKLAATCKVWEFLKYYHPKVANGAQNCDQQLFDILPKIDNAQTNNEF